MSNKKFTTRMRDKYAGVELKRRRAGADDVLDLCDAIEGAERMLECLFKEIEALKGIDATTSNRLKSQISAELYYLRA